ncbi:MAG: Wzz/FepE/Etk N-terminal domain-containing protein [Candidatus Latescibacterota bacterium]|nr:Wzz/FepE/Etk N-terminal domain-containing protein [Candidatus Latescibacterota bacterium]MEC8646930.1 Wzz/FepE/Etk N-terminal domain-containing protein [Candidatus Latescibacterota bacterium]
MEKKEVDILDLFSALHAARGLIVGGTLLVCVLAGALSFLIPKEYEATAQLLPPKEQKQGFGFSDLLSALPIPTLRLGEKGTPADIFIATLKSMHTRRSMVHTFSLKERYGVETMTDAVETLAEKTVIDKSEEGTIVISVLDRDPQMAAQMANHYTVILDSTNKSIGQISARERMGFIQVLRIEGEARLDSVMGNLQEFQSEHNAISIEDQARAVIGAAAAMQTDAMELEIMRQGMIASGLDESHDRVKKLEREILLRQDAMTFLRDGLNTDSRGMMRGPQALEMEENLFLPLRDIPKVAQDYAILEKDVLVQKALMQLLLQQEAESLIESRNNTATVQVLDPAIPPEIKARPQRVLIVFIAGVLSLFASISYTLGAVYVRNLRQRWLADRAEA